MTPNELKKWRNNHGVTQSQVAQLLGLKNRSSICLLENGKRPITKMMELATKQITYRIQIVRAKKDIGIFSNLLYEMSQ